MTENIKSRHFDFVTFFDVQVQPEGSEGLIQSSENILYNLKF